MVIFQLTLLTGPHGKEINLAAPQKHRVYPFTRIYRFRKLHHRGPARWDGRSLGSTIPQHNSWCVLVGRQEMPPTAGTNPGGFQRL